MTVATIDRTRIHVDREAPSASPCFTVVLVVPAGDLPTCAAAIANARARGAATFTCEVPVDADGFDDAFSAIVDAVDRAGRSFPASPIVLVGHGSAAIPARAYADLCPDIVTGMVMTQGLAA